LPVVGAGGAAARMVDADAIPAQVDPQTRVGVDGVLADLIPGCGRIRDADARSLVISDDIPRVGADAVAVGPAPGGDAASLVSQVDLAGDVWTDEVAQDAIGGGVGIRDQHTLKPTGCDDVPGPLDSPANCVAAGGEIDQYAVGAIAHGGGAGGIGAN